MAEDNERKPEERPTQEPQIRPDKPMVTIPPKPRPELIDIQTEGLRPDIEEKKNKK
jgi:hypothetical protein